MGNLEKNVKLHRQINNKSALQHCLWYLCVVYFFSMMILITVIQYRKSVYIDIFVFFRI